MYMVRMANIEDARGIAEVHVESWKTTYSGIIKPAILDQITVERRQQNWEQVIRNQNNNDDHKLEFVYVAENEAGKIVGFASGGPSRSPEYHYDGELNTIYLLQEVQGQGIGRSLITSVARELYKRSLTSMICWVFKANSAKAFYEKTGAKVVDEKEFTIGDQRIPECLMGWEDISHL